MTSKIFSLTASLLCLRKLKIETDKMVIEGDIPIKQATAQK